MADNINNSILSKTDLFNELSQLIEECKQQVAVQTNSAVTILFWQIGNRINQDILQNKRAEYSKQIVSTVSTQLKERYGKNFELRNLRRMMQFAEQFTDFQIVVPLMVAEYWTDLPPKKQFEEKIHMLLIEAKEKIERKKLV